MAFNCQDKQGKPCGSWRFCTFTTKVTARATEFSDPCRGAVRFKRSFPWRPEPFQRTKLNQQPEYSACEGSSGIPSCPGFALKFPEGNKTNTSPNLNWNCCLTLIFKTFYSRAREKSFHEPEDFCPQSSTHFIAVPEQPVGWDENNPWSDGSGHAVSWLGHISIWSREIRLGS